MSGHIPVSIVNLGECLLCHSSGDNLMFFVFSFSFKTKGNLTKHMKSKAHYKKCVELGINPIPILVDDDADMEGDQQSISSERTSTHTADTDSDDDSDGDDGESESSGKMILRRLYFHSGYLIR